VRWLSDYETVVGAPSQKSNWCEAVSHLATWSSRQNRLGFLCGQRS